MLLSRFFCIARASRPRRGTPRNVAPQNDAPIAECSTFRFHNECSARGRSGDPTGKEKAGREKRRQPTRAKPPDVTLVSRKMVNILIVDPHGSSVVGIKLYIIKSGRIGRTAGRRGLSDDQVLIRRWKTPDNQRFRLVLLSARKRNLQSRAVRLSGARESVHTHARAGAGGRIHRARPAVVSRRTERRGAPKAVDLTTVEAGRRGWDTYRVEFDERRRDSPR